MPQYLALDKNHKVDLDFQANNDVEASRFARDAGCIELVEVLGNGQFRIVYTDNIFGRLIKFFGLNPRFF